MMINKDNYIAIYGLADPHSGKLRYVGQSCNPERRLQEHIRSPSQNLQNWMRVLMLQHEKPQLTIFEWVMKSNADSLEEWWINWAVRKEQPILNTMLVPTEHRDFYRQVEGCPDCGMFCGWTLRSGCGFQESGPIFPCDVTIFRLSTGEAKNYKVLMATCCICGEAGVVKKENYKLGMGVVVHCSQCGKYFCRRCGCCICKRG